MIGVIEGRVHRLKHNIDIDQIYPRQFLDLEDPESMKSKLFIDYDNQAPLKLNSGDILVAGRCFGWGPYRGSALIALRHAGIRCVVASSFGRQFYRGALNMGIPPIIIPDIREKVKDGETVSIDFEKGEFRVRKEILKFEKFVFPLNDILAAGGLIEYLKANPGKSY